MKAPKTTETFSYEVSREMPARLKATWAAWTDPASYGGWFGAIPGSVELDVRPGGSWRLTLPPGDSDEPETMSGVYHEVVPGELLVMSTHFVGGDTVMEMRFTAAEDTTRIAISQSSPSREERDGGREGAEILLALCADYLAGSDR